MRHEISFNRAAAIRSRLTPDNAYGEFCRVEVMFNKHRMNPAVVSIAPPRLDPA